MPSPQTLSLHSAVQPSPSSELPSSHSSPSSTLPSPQNGSGSPVVVVVVVVSAVSDSVASVVVVVVLVVLVVLVVDVGGSVVELGPPVVVVSLSVSVAAVSVSPAGGAGQAARRSATDARRVEDRFLLIMTFASPEETRVAGPVCTSPVLEITTPWRTEQDAGLAARRAAKLACSASSRASADAAAPIAYGILSPMSQKNSVVLKPVLPTPFTTA